MRTTLTKHIETWELEVRREDGDDWPDLPLEFGRSVSIRPDMIRVVTHAGHEETFLGQDMVAIGGPKLKSGGLPGALRGTNVYYKRHQVPQWALPIADAACDEAGFPKVTA